MGCCIAPTWLPSCPVCWPCLLLQLVGRAVTHLRHEQGEVCCHCCAVRNIPAQYVVVVPCGVAGGPREGALASFLQPAKVRGPQCWVLAQPEDGGISGDDRVSKVGLHALDNPLQAVHGEQLQVLDLTSSFPGRHVTCRPTHRAKQVERRSRTSHDFLAEVFNDLQPASTSGLRSRQAVQLVATSTRRMSC